MVVTLVYLLINPSTCICMLWAIYVHEFQGSAFVLVSIVIGIHFEAQSIFCRRLLATAVMPHGPS